MRVRKFIENYSDWSFPQVDMEKIGPNYGKSSIGDVGSVFGNIGDLGNKRTPRLSIMKDLIHDEDNDIFYTKEEIDDILEAYRLYCVKNNIESILNDDSYLDGVTLTYIKKLIAENE